MLGIIKQISEKFTIFGVLSGSCAGSHPDQLDGSPKIAQARSGELGTTAEVIRRTVRSRTTPHRRCPFRRGQGKAKYGWPRKRPVGTRREPEEP